MHELDAHGADRLPHHRRYDFTDGARRVLLSAVSPRELLRTAEAVTQRIEAAVGRAPVFPAWVGHPDGAAVIDDTGRSFGWLREQALTRLGIPSTDARPVAPMPKTPRVPGARPGIPPSPGTPQPPGLMRRTTTRRVRPRQPAGWTSCRRTPYGSVDSGSVHAVPTVGPT
ncbi:hypothetical protein D3C59_18170 [Streptomyces sp. SHP22-7]|nr:hypothetical protein D3C59_18170 [Streptomyces sp. SHP22-7]